MACFCAAANVLVTVSFAQVVEEFELPQLTKLQTNIPKAEDILWCGNLEQYDDQYDRISTRSERRLQVGATWYGGSILGCYDATRALIHGVWQPLFCNTLF